MAFYGFKIESRNLNIVETTINEMKKEVNKKAQKIYCELLSKEIQIIIDEIATNVYERPDSSIFKVATDLLNKKIAVAIAKNYNTEYNFNIVLNIFNYDNATYLELATYNSCFFDATKNVKNLIDFSVDDLVDDNTQKQRGSVWQKIFEKYKDHSCLMIKLFPIKAFEVPKYEDLHFDSKIQRADTIARHRLTNQYLIMYAGGGEIQNYKLMEYIDQALMKMTDYNSKTILNSYKENLLTVLPEITESLIFDCPESSVNQ
jgi:hypothetical protein